MLCSIPGIGVLLQSASLMVGIAGDIVLRAAALLPPADVAIKDFSLSYPVSGIFHAPCARSATCHGVLANGSCQLEHQIWRQPQEHSRRFGRSVASGHVS